MKQNFSGPEISVYRLNARNVLCKNCPNTEFFLIRIKLDRIRRFTE